MLILTDYILTLIDQILNFKYFNFNKIYFIKELTVNIKI
jgi:hypothetical protein